MKYLKELFWVTMIGQSLVWGIVFLSSLLPDLLVSFFLGLIGYSVGAAVYALCSDVKARK